MIRKTLYLICILTITICCTEKKKQKEAVTEIKETKTIIKKDLNDIKKDGVLKAITIYSGTSYFLYRGMPMGFEYELLKRYAKHLGLKLEIVLARNMNELFDMLNNGEGDIIAHGITVTEPRRKIVDFTEYHFLAKQVLVQRKPDNWRKMKLHLIQKELISDPIELIGDTVSLRHNSSYHQRIQNLSDEIGGKIIVDTVSGNLSTDELIKMVVDKKIKYTFSDNNIAAINQSYYPQLDISVDVSFSQRIAWATRKNSPELLAETDKWIKKMKKKAEYYVIYNKYFKNSRSFRKRASSEFYSKNSNKISIYDDLLKKYSKKIGWDWRFVSALVYQESQFNPEAKSWVGAQGLMQMMPPTAKSMGVTDVTNPEDNIKGGTKFLDKLWKMSKSIPDSVQRIKFVLASYNCGFYHVEDAKRLAKKHGKDPQIWDNNVDEFVLKLTYPQYYQDEVVKYGYVRGTEPYNYVKHIFDRYDHYKQFIKL